MKDVNYWVVIPAAGIGERARTQVPKQYLMLHNKSVLQHSIELFVNLTWVNKVVVALHPNDQHFQQLKISYPKLQLVKGGAQRFNSVMNALNEIKGQASDDDWILVHDAVRPCLHPHDLNNLKQQLLFHDVGGILAQPVQDTLKSVLNNEIQNTIPRDNIWCALTPQMFRFKLLYESLQLAHSKDIALTDDCAYIENADLQPVIVEARYPNPKLTYAKDIPYLDYLIQSKEGEVII